MKIERFSANRFLHTSDNKSTSQVIQINIGSHRGQQGMKGEQNIVVFTLSWGHCYRHNAHKAATLGSPSGTRETKVTRKVSSRSLYRWLLKRCRIGLDKSQTYKSWHSSTRWFVIFNPPVIYQSTFPTKKREIHTWNVIPSTKGVSFLWIKHPYPCYSDRLSRCILIIPFSSFTKTVYQNGGQCVTAGPRRFDARTVIAALYEIIGIFLTCILQPSLQLQAFEPMRSVHNLYPVKDNHLTKAVLFEELIPSNKQTMLPT